MHNIGEWNVPNPPSQWCSKYFGHRAQVFFELLVKSIMAISGYPDKPLGYDIVIESVR